MTIEELVQDIRRIKNNGLFDDRIKEGLVMKNVQKYAWHNLMTFDQAIEEIEKYIENEED